MNISIRRNELIADIFARMNKVERMGTGIKRMRNAMKSAGLPYPKIKTDSFFSITFQRPAYNLKDIKVTKNQETILVNMKSNPYITAKELSGIIGISDRKIKENIKKLKEIGLIKRVGSAKGGHWEVAE
ncbi:MAG: ATP-binding protein [Nitrospirota bacterium]